MSAIEETCASEVDGLVPLMMMSCLGDVGMGKDAGVWDVAGWRREGVVEEVSWESVGMAAMDRRWYGKGTKTHIGELSFHIIVASF